jgi:hypothetical protein
MTTRITMLLRIPTPFAVLNQSNGRVKSAVKKTIGLSTKITTVDTKSEPLSNLPIGV